MSIEASVTGPLLDSEDTLRLSCGAEANPAPEITWLRIPRGDTELELVSQGRELVLSPVTKEDRGQSFNVLNKSYVIYSRRILLHCQQRLWFREQNLRD